MKKSILRFLTLTLCLLFLSPLLTPSAQAADTASVYGDLEYTVADGAVTITACRADAEGKITIPAAIDGAAVTALGDRAFAECEKVTEVSLPKGLKTIGEECFKDSGLTSLSLPQTVETIGSGAFSTPTLTSLTVQRGSKYFVAGKGVLFNKKQTELVCFPAGKTGSYTIPLGIRTIRERAFERSGLTALTLSARGKLNTIGERAFSGSALKSISLPKNVKEIGPYAFADCAALESAALGSGVTALDEGVFSGCTALKNVTLPEEMTSIGNGAFQGCTALGSLELPAALDTLGERAFAGCTALETAALPSDLAAIPAGLFDECTALTGITLPPRCETIGDAAFQGSGLTSVIFPASVTAIGERAFASCASLGEVSFDHDAVDELTIGKDAFALTGTGAATTLRVPETDQPGAAISGYDWSGSGRAVTWAQNEDFAVRTVKLTGAVNAYGGVEIRWESLDKATGYLVLRKAPDAAEWDLVDISKSTTYLDRSAISGQRYVYTVQGESGDAYSKYNHQGVIVDYVASPVLNDPYGNFNGVVFSWKPVKGAANYRVFRKTPGTDWQKLTDTTATSYTDRAVVLGNEYTYTVGCVSGDGQTILSSHDPLGRTITYYPLATPTDLSLRADNTGVRFTWSAVRDATHYRVFRQTNGGGWVHLTDTTATGYTDTSVVVGNTYTYTVRCVSADGKNFLSDFYHPGVSLKRAGIPGLISATSKNGGVEIKWSTPTGAVKYRVFRKTGSENWKKVGETNSTSFIDKTAKSGVKYVYTVRCITADSRFFAGDYNHTGLTVTYVATPKLQSITGKNGGVEIKWGGVSGAAKYRLFRKSGSSGWTPILDTTGTSYVDGSVSSGTKYTYTVRCITSDGSAFTSEYDHSGLTITYLAAPTLNSVAKGGGGVQIQWNKVGGASKYRVFRKTGSENWKKIADTSSTSYVDKSAKPGVTYTYTVRCLTPDGKSFAGGYNSTGLTIAYN